MPRAALAGPKRRARTPRGGSLWIVSRWLVRTLNIGAVLSDRNPTAAYLASPFGPLGAEPAGFEYPSFFRHITYAESSSRKQPHKTPASERRTPAISFMIPADPSFASAPSPAGSRPDIRLHPICLVDRCGRRCRQEVYQRLGGQWLLGDGGRTRHVYQVRALQIGW